MGMVTTTRNLIGPILIHAYLLVLSLDISSNSPLFVLCVLNPYELISGLGELFIRLLQ